MAKPYSFGGPLGGKALVLLVILGAVPALASEPTLRVRSRLRIDLEHVQRLDKGILVRGVLRDSASEEPVAGRTVAISVDGPNGFYRFAEPTSPDGAFRWRVPLKAGEYTLRLAAGGDPDYAAASPIERRLDLSRRSPVVTLRITDQVSVADSGLTAIVEASDPEDDLDAPLGATVAAPGARPAELEVKLSVGGRVLATLVTHGGRAEHTFVPAQLGKPGDKLTLTARFGGDPQRNPAEASRTVRLTTPTTLTLAGGASLPWRGSLELTGILADASGPVAGERVTVATTGADPIEIASGTTGANGRFTIALKGGTLPPGPHFIEARYAPQVSFREPSRSAAHSLEALHPEPWPLAWWLSPIACALGLVLAQVVRKRPWRRLMRQRVEARLKKTARVIGFTESRPRLLQQLRPPHDLGVTGVVCEHPTGVPVAGATVRVHAGGVVHELATGADGRFAFEALPPGPIAVEVEARGYVGERLERSLPHRGELRGARVLLVPVRARVFAVWRALALPHLPRPSLAEIWTPRELLSHVRSRRMITGELAALTSLVEVACFGPLLPDASVLQEAERLAAAAASRTPPPRA
jgi:hypothetical protein